MRDTLRGIAIGVLLLAIGGALAARLGIADLAVPRADGTGPWLVSRALGFAAYAALALDAIVGLLLSTRVGDRVLGRAAAVELHGWLSPLALGLVASHAALLLADGYIRFDALDVLVPFAAPYRPLAVALGVVAAYLALVVHASFALRKRIGVRTWRRLHYLSFVAFVGATVHGLAAGTDTGRPWAIVLYGVPLAIVVALVGKRLVPDGSRPRQPAA